MEREHPDIGPTYNEMRKKVYNVTLYPLLHMQYRVSDNADVFADGTLNDFTRKFEVNIEWITRLKDVTEFVELDRQYIQEMRDLTDEQSWNAILESHVSAFVGGESGSNTLDYEDIVNQPVNDVKQHVESLEDGIDWGQMYDAELAGKDRVSLKQWIDKRRVEDRGERYDNIRFARLKERPFYPERIGNLGFGFIGAPSIAWWDGPHTMLGFIEGYDEAEDNKDFQKVAREEFASLSVNGNCQQRLEVGDDGSVAPRHSYDLGHSLELGEFEWFFRQTIPDDHLSRAAEYHGYDSASAAEDAAIETVLSILEDALTEYNIGQNETVDTIDNLDERVDVQW